MNITFIITGLGVGGAETMLLKLVQHLDRRRFTPDIVSLSSVGDLGPRFSALGIPILALDMAKDWRGLGALARLRRHLRASRSDFVHTWMYHADLLGGIAARSVGIRNLAWGIRHSNLSPQLNKRSTLAVASVCARLSHWMPSDILVCSHAARQNHIEYGYSERKIQVIPNGFDIARFVPEPLAREAVRSELRVAPDTPLIGLVARWDPQKNHKGFLRAMGLLHRREPRARFLLVGKGVDDNNGLLQAAARDAGIQAYCHFLGPRNDIPRLMAALDVMVSSSLGEAFPNVLGEAMSCGIPCVATKVGDCAEIIGDTGLLVEDANDTQGIAMATDTLLTLSKAQRQTLGDRARQRIVTHFDIHRVVQMYENFYSTTDAASRQENSKRSR
jgi:glycosyltransferase involved in cell wall biosynthesis